MSLSSGFGTVSLLSPNEQHHVQSGSMKTEKTGPKLRTSPAFGAMQLRRGGPKAPSPCPTPRAVGPSCPAHTGTAEKRGHHPMLETERGDPLHSVFWKEDVTHSPSSSTEMLLFSASANDPAQRGSWASGSASSPRAWRSR